MSRKSRLLRNCVYSEELRERCKYIILKKKTFLLTLSCLKQKFLNKQQSSSESSELIKMTKSDRIDKDGDIDDTDCDINSDDDYIMIGLDVAICQNTLQPSPATDGRRNTKRHTHTHTWNPLARYKLVKTSKVTSRIVGPQFYSIVDRQTAANFLSPPPPPPATKVGVKT